MPLDVARLRDSDLAANESPEACWAAVQLWAASWHQVPAASIPDDDKWMAKQTGYGRSVKDWMKVRVGALRGWISCTDGRLYHPVVAEKAIEAWQAKLDQRWRTECGRIKKHNDRHGTTHPKPSYEEWFSMGCPQGQHLSVPRDKSQCPSTVTGETSSKGEGERQGQGEPLIPSVANATDGDAVNGSPKASVGKTPEELSKAELWRAAVSLLDGQGMGEPQARTFIGKLAKDYPHGEVVADAIRAAISTQPADARSYLISICKHAVGQRQHAAPANKHAGAAAAIFGNPAEQDFAHV